MCDPQRDRIGRGRAEHLSAERLSGSPPWLCHSTQWPGQQQQLCVGPHRPRTPMPWACCARGSEAHGPMRRPSQCRPAPPPDEPAEAKVGQPLDHTAQSLRKGMGKLRHRSRAEPWLLGPLLSLLGSLAPCLEKGSQSPMPPSLQSHRHRPWGHSWARASRKGPPTYRWPQSPASPLGPASSPSCLFGWAGQGLGAAGPLQSPYCLQPHPFFS